MFLLYGRREYNMVIDITSTGDIGEEK